MQTAILQICVLYLIFDHNGHSSKHKLHALFLYNTCKGIVFAGFRVYIHAGRCSLVTVRPYLCSVIAD